MQRSLYSTLLTRSPVVAPLAVWATGTHRVADEMFTEAARATAKEVTGEQRGLGLLSEELVTGVFSTGPA